MKSIRFPFLWLILLVSFTSYGQKQRDRFSPERLRQSYEHIQKIDASVFYEQRIYRNPMVGLFEMRKIMADTSIKTYVPLLQGMPIGAYRMGETVEFQPLQKKMRTHYIKSSTFPLQLQQYKFDFWLQPYITAQFGNFSKPVESNTSIALQTQILLLPGLSFNTGLLVPITNQLDGRPQDIRPAPTYLNQFLVVGKNYLSASAGFFANDQYGVNVQYRHADLSKPWSFGLEAGLTGFYYYPKGGIYYERLTQLLLLADVSYRFAAPDVTLKLSGGQFLWKDQGARLEMIRQFTNVALGLYGTKTKNGSTVGFHIAVPIPPGKILQGKNARLRMADEFRWEYTYTRGYKIGERYRMGYNLDEKLRQFHRDYLNNQYKQLK